MLSKSSALVLLVCLLFFSYALEASPILIRLRSGEYREVGPDLRGSWPAFQFAMGPVGKRLRRILPESLTKEWGRYRGLYMHVEDVAYDHARGRIYFLVSMMVNPATPMGQLLEPPRLAPAEPISLQILLYSAVGLPTHFLLAVNEEGALLSDFGTARSPGVLFLSDSDRAVADHLSDPYRFLARVIQESEKMGGFGLGGDWPTLVQRIGRWRGRLSGRIAWDSSFSPWTWNQSRNLLALDPEGNLHAVRGFVEVPLPNQAPGDRGGIHRFEHSAFDWEGKPILAPAMHHFETENVVLHTLAVVPSPSRVLLGYSNRAAIQRPGSPMSAFFALGDLSPEGLDDMVPIDVPAEFGCSSAVDQDAYSAIVGSSGGILLSKSARDDFTHYAYVDSRAVKLEGHDQLFQYADGAPIFPAVWMGFDGRVYFKGIHGSVDALGETDESVAVGMLPRGHSSVGLPKGCSVSLYLMGR